MSLRAKLQMHAPKRAAIAVESKRHVRGMAGVDSLAAARFQRRLSPAATPLMYMCDGDHNGVCHYIGTAYGQQKFVNPALSGRLQVCYSPLEIGSCYFRSRQAQTFVESVRAQSHRNIFKIELFQSSACITRGLHRCLLTSADRDSN